MKGTFSLVVIIIVFAFGASYGARIAAHKKVSVEFGSYGQVIKSTQPKGITYL